MKKGSTGYMDKFNKKVLLLIIDILAIQIASFFSIYIRFDFQFADIPTRFLN